MHTAMSRRFVMVVVLIASTFVPRGAFASITCVSLNGTNNDGYTYCCALRDSLGNFSVARCRLPCNQGCGTYKDRLACNDCKNNACCSAKQNCGYLCVYPPVKLIGSSTGGPAVPGGVVFPAHFSSACDCGAQGP